MKQKKKFQELNLCDNFLFAATMEKPEICKSILELLLKIKIDNVAMLTEKGLTVNSDYRGIRMDVYAADEEQTVYNVEMQTTNKQNLPKRSRLYQAHIDVQHLKPGEDFNQLNKSFVIFICTFDPFGYGRYTYTIEERCLEEDFPLGDGTRKIFLNTRGTDCETDTEVIQFLKYVEKSTSECVEETDSAFVKRLHECVMQIKYDRRMEERYMLFEELMADEKAAGLKQGLEQGLERGQDLVLKLIAAMLADGKTEEISRLSEDPAFFADMIKKYLNKQS